MCEGESLCNVTEAAVALHSPEYHRLLIIENFQVGLVVPVDKGTRMENGWQELTLAKYSNLLIY